MFLQLLFTLRTISRDFKWLQFRGFLKLLSPVSLGRAAECLTFSCQQSINHLFYYTEVKEVKEAKCQGSPCAFSFNRHNYKGDITDLTLQAMNVSPGIQVKKQIGGNNVIQNQVQLPPKRIFLIKPILSSLDTDTFKTRPQEKKKKKLDLMRHFSPCVGTVLSFGNSNFFLLQIFYNNTMRSTTLFPHAMSYVPTKNLRPEHCYLFCTFEICFLRSKADLTCTVLGSLIIMNVKITRSLCSQDYHYT